MLAVHKLAVCLMQATMLALLLPAQGRAQDAGKISLPEGGVATDAQPEAGQAPEATPTAATVPHERGACLPLTARELFDAGEFAPENPTYPVSLRFDFSPTQEGEEILAVRKFECEGARSFVLFTRGTYRKRAADGTIAFQRSQNLSVVNNFNASGDAWNFAVSSASRDEADTWCLPKKEFCSKKVDRRAHGLRDEAQAEIIVPQADAYSLRHGEDLVLQAAVTRLCGKPPVPRKLCMTWTNGDPLCVTLAFEQASAMFPQLAADPPANCPEDPASPGTIAPESPPAEAVPEETNQQ